MTKFAKCVALCGVLFLFICGVVLSGCRKTQQQDGDTGTTTDVGFDAEVLEEDDDLTVEIETNGTDKISGTSTSCTSQIVVQSTDGTATGTTQSTTKSTASTTSKVTSSVSSSKNTQPSDTTTTTTTVRTRDEGWTPDLGTKPQ